MKPALIFPSFFLGEFMDPVHCARCGKTAAARYVGAPRIEWCKDGIIELIYPTRCPCGGTCEVLRVRMHTLLLGHALFWFLVGKIGSRSGRQTASELVSASKPSLFSHIQKHFERHLQEFAAAKIPPPTDVDRRQFGMDQREWEEFMRRLTDEPQPPPAAAS